jgi:hypothetical protein
MTRADARPSATPADKEESMKKILSSLAVVVALGSASPGLANDVTGDRYSPYRNAQPPARSTAAVESTRDAQPENAPCACHCMKSAAHDETAARAPDGR